MSRTFWIDVFLFLHVLGAIAAVGPTITYALWARLGERAGPGQRAFAINGISWVDSHLATPAFMTQAVTGIVLILLLEISFLHTAWLLTGVIIYVVVTVLAVTVLTPLVKRQIELADQVASDPSDPALEGQLAAATARVALIGRLVGVLTLAIVFFMVVKPTLWSAG